ncbi:hypothetical protein GCM10023194_81000 [Planotetraspora phitsanulokensis]|uniref:Uncharacterized protein n=1 Tax=Planotetraspora phitsanulokensis TaxID=575192 RepID=A0A8J3XNI2_9ACTN|nr:hypothetical protein [Planotetraspora phitsanulokensis]GII42858.1 hypothetical protein Pph01_78610 [Planotetraspora phitsanulokensis]
MSDVTAYITRDGIRDLVVDLLGMTLDDPAHTSVEIPSTTVNGHYENPVSVQRAFRSAVDARADDEFDPDTWPELFDTEYGDDDDSLVVSAIEDFDPDEDRRVALEIIRALTARFPLTPNERASL